MKKRWKSDFPLGRKLQKIFRCMKLTFLLLTCFVVQTFASLNAQTVTIKKQNASLEEVIWELKQQTRFTFMYNNEDIAQIKGIDLNEKEVDVEKILQKCLKNTNLEYVVLNNAIVIKLKMNTLDEKKSVTLKGWVYDKKKDPIPGVTVKLTNINLGTATNNKGWFSLSLPLTKGTLEFSFVGFKTQRINFTERTDTLRIILEEDVQALDEAVVVAYGNTTKRKMTGAVSTIKADEIKGIPTSSIANLLQGRVAGMDITNISGAPGGGDIAVTIRGYNSLDVEQKRRFSNPLWVVDGVPLNAFTSPITGTNLLADLNPDMIESIQVLKDASSAAIYGSRAANGVIIVTTKKGLKDQDATFSVNFSQSWSILPRYPDLTSGRAEREFRLAANRKYYRAYLDKETNRWKYPTSLREQYDYGSQGAVLDKNWIPDLTYAGTGNGTMFQDSLNPFYNNSTNFFKMYFETGKITNANIQTYGGSARTTYAIGLGLYDETGIYKGTGFQRIDLNANMNVNPVKKLTIDLRLNASITHKKRASSNASENLQYSNQAVPVETIPGEPYQLSSLLPGKGSIVWEQTLNAYKGTKETNRSVRLRTNMKLGYEIIEGLNISSSLAADYIIDRRNYFQPANLSYNGYSKSIGETGINLMILNENLLTYKKTIHENHHIDFVAGFSYQYDQEEYNGGYAQNSPSDKIYYAPDGMPDIGYEDWGEGETHPIAFKNYQSDMQEKCLLSYFARLEYGFRDKYLLSLSVRRDGSSTLGKNNRWGTFPSIAAGWNFSEENWIKDNLPWFSFGKFRASWGRSGMHFAQNYLALGIFVTDIPYMGNGMLRPQWFGGLYNDKLSWEETDQYDFGLDLDFFDYRLSFTIDYYYRLTDKLLNRISLPSGDYQRYDSQWRNAKTISNEGLEVMARYEIFRKPELYWKISINAARNWNRFKESENGKDDDTRIIGKALNGIYLLKTDGYINDQNEMPLFYNAAGISSYLGGEYGNSTYYKPGDYKYIDVNGDGKVGFEDRVYSGSALPEISGGIVNEFRWKNFDLNMLISYQLGRHMINYVRKRCLLQPERFPTIVMNLNDVTFWEKPGDKTTFPMWQGGAEDNWNTVQEDVEKVNWLKLKTLTLGYSLPKNWIKRCGLSELRIFASGENLFTWTNYSGIEPETVDIRTGIDGDDGALPYPLARKYTLGLTIKF